MIADNWKHAEFMQIKMSSFHFVDAGFVARGVQHEINLIMARREREKMSC